MAKQWYVLQSYSQFEQYVKKQLQEVIEREGMQDSFGQILIPTEEVVEVKENKKRVSQRKFFPGYVLVEMEMNNDTWHLVNSIPKMSGFVGGTHEKPAPRLCAKCRRGSRNLVRKLYLKLVKSCGLLTDLLLILPERLKK